MEDMFSCSPCFEKSSISILILHTRNITNKNKFQNNYLFLRSGKNRNFLFVISSNQHKLVAIELYIEIMLKQ